MKKNEKKKKKIRRMQHLNFRCKYGFCLFVCLFTFFSCPVLATGAFDKTARVADVRDVLAAASIKLSVKKDK